MEIHRFFLLNLNIIILRTDSRFLNAFITYLHSKIKQKKKKTENHNKIHITHYIN